MILIRLPRRRRLMLVILLPALAIAATAAWAVGMHHARPGYGFWPAITGRLPSVQLLADSDTSVLVNPSLYGPVSAAELPWSATPPAKLLAQQQEHQATQLVAAFKTTLPEPLEGELANVTHAATLLAGSVVMPGQVFSQNAVAGPYTAARGYHNGPMYLGSQVMPTEGGGVCKIATNLYNVATLANLKIVERHPHSMMVPYVPPGQDATVYFGGKDFRFLNDKRTPIVIWAAVQDKTLYIAFYGQYTPIPVRWHHYLMAVHPPPVIRSPNRSLAKGEERVLFAGYPAVTVRSWLTLEPPGQPAQWKDLGVDYYRPLPGQLEYGP